LGRGFCISDEKDEGSKSNGNSKIIGSGIIGLSPNFKNGPPQ
jgi:hypothetical protein